MDLESPERQGRRSGRPLSQIQSTERRSSKQVTSNARAGKAARERFTDKTIRAVTPESPTESTTVPNIQETILATSPSSLPRDDLKGSGRDPATSISSCNEGSQVRVKPPRHKPNRRTSEEAPLTSSPSSLLSKTRVRLGSITTGNPFSARPTDETSNSIGFPSIMSSPTSSSIETKMHQGGRKTQRLAKPDPSVAPTDFLCSPRGKEIRSPPMNSDSTTILHLMKRTCGRMHGLLLFRLANVRTWSSGYCAIHVASGSLIYQTEGESAQAKTLIPDLRGCKVRSLYDTENECNYLSLSTASSGLRIHLRPTVPETFDSWLAALLCWQPIRPKGIQNKMTKPQYISIIERRAAETRRASEASATRNPAIIKVGRMLLWEGSTDTDASYPTTSRRISTYKQLRAISQSWQRISCTLLENGYFKLLTESDAQVISALRLSSLCRCAIQQLNPSVLQDEYCLAIYPQYVTEPCDDIQSKPIYLSLESRVLFEVWFVLLRAFTVPELYGPEQPVSETLSPQRMPGQNANSNPCQGLFRVERSLSVKITEAKLVPKPAREEAGEQAPGQKGLTTGAAAEGCYAEIVLDGEPRGRTSAKSQKSMFWIEDFVFGDLPPVLSSALVLLKVRNPDEKEWTTVTTGSYTLSQGDISPINVDGAIQVSSHDTVLGKIELQLDDMERGVEIDQRWPILDSGETPIGHALMKLRLTETIVLMKEDYSPLLDLLRNFSNGLTVAIARTIPAELKSISDIFLDIFQVCGDASEWIMTLVEDEIDGVHQEVSSHGLRYNNRIHSNDSYGSAEDRELVVRDLGRSATLEANLLFRANTLLTKALDAHMRRLGKEYLEETIGERLRDIDESDPDCEVDPSKVRTPHDLNRNWGNLTTLTMTLWAAISSSASRCPIELRQLFRHIKSCAETRYGDFLRTVAYSSVSGFLFLRFFCPAILNPKLFGLLKDTPRLRAQRTLTLIAKSLQGLANMSTFGAKEPWMEPMNRFLQSSRPEFKAFVDQICSVPSERPSQAVPASFATPIQILGRLPPTSREGFPSLPFLIDSAKSFATLISLWLQKCPRDLETKFQKDHALRRFHELCTQIQQRTKDCLSSAEPAELPTGGLEPQWERLLEQRERYAAFQGELASGSFRPPVDAERAMFRGPADRRHSHAFLLRRPSPPFIPEASEEMGPETLQNSPTAVDDHNMLMYSRMRPQDTKESASSSKNSSTLSLEEGGSSRMRSNTGTRDGSTRARLFKDFVSGTARRKLTSYYVSLGQSKKKVNLTMPSPMTMVSNRRKKLVASRRRREDDGEEEGSMAGDLEDDSLSEGSIISNGDEDDHDVEASEISEDEVAKAPHLEVGLGLIPKEPDARAIQPKFATSLDTSAMMNGLKLDDGKVVPAVGFDEPVASVPDSVVEEARPHPKASKDGPAERSRKGHSEYLKQRKEDPAFVPNRGGFFLHDNRGTPSGSLGFRTSARAHGRGVFRGAPQTVNRGYKEIKYESDSTQYDSNESAYSIVSPKPTGPEQILFHFDPVGEGPSHHQSTGPPLRRDKPVRVSLPNQQPRYIFPSTDRSFIFIPRALRPNQQGFGRGRGRSSFNRSRRTSIYGGSAYTPSVAMSRRSSVGCMIPGEVVRSPGESAMLPPQSHAAPPGKPVVRIPPAARPLGWLPSPITQQVNAGPNTAVPTQSAQQSHGGQEQVLDALQMHQPQPQKTVSVADIESPARFNFNPPPQQQEQPFHQQMPATAKAHVYVEDGAGYNAHVRRMSHISLPSGTPLSQIPERAIYAQPFQPFAVLPAAAGYPPAYPPGTVFYPALQADIAAYGNGVGPHMHSAFLPGAHPHPYMVPTATLAAAASADGNLAAGTVAHESNGMVYYYDSSQFPASSPAHFSAPFAGSAMGGVVGMGGMMTPPTQFFYPSVNNGVYYPAP